MSVFLRILVGILAGTILCLILSKYNKDFSLVLSIVICCTSIAGAFLYLDPIIGFIDGLKALGNLDTQMFSILLKVTGIGLLSEITAMICKDAGNDTLGKTLQIIGVFVMLYLSLPMLTRLLELMNTVLGSI